MNDSGELIEEIGLDRFLRVDADHPIDWRINDRTPPTKLVLKSKKRPPEFAETTGVEIAVIEQHSGQYATVFVLKDVECADNFKVFCDDVIESSREIDPDEATDFAFERFAKWMHLFKPCYVNRLSDREIRGLIGELFVLETKFIPKFGPVSALNSWMNLLKGKQDFIEHDQWYEVKTLLEGNDAIRINSLEQLSRKDKGELIVVGLKKSSPEAVNGRTLNSMYSDILEMLPTYALKKRFSEIMLKNGYIINDPYYDTHCFEIIGATGYDVRDGFPRLTPDNLPYNGILSAKYDISSASIKGFEVERWN